MTYKQIEASREARLWLGTIIGPVIILAAAVLTEPELRHAIGDKWGAMKRSIKQKFTKKKS